MWYVLILSFHLIHIHLSFFSTPHFHEPNLASLDLHFLPHPPWLGYSRYFPILPPFLLISCPPSDPPSSPTSYHYPTLIFPIEDDMSLSLAQKVPILMQFHEKLYQPGWNFSCMNSLISTYAFSYDNPFHFTLHTIKLMLLCRWYRTRKDTHRKLQRRNRLLFVFASPSKLPSHSFPFF